MDRALHRSILVGEDEPLLAMDIEMTLMAAGFHVVGPAKADAEALSLLKTDNPDLVILALYLDVALRRPCWKPDACWREEEHRPHRERAI